MTSAVATDAPVRRDPLAILLAIVLPPLGLYRVTGPGRDFWIACGLTLLGFLPGMAFALHQLLIGRPR